MYKIKTVAIIGGGVAGLSAAGLLSRNGFDVKLFEANDKLGGCCATTNIDGYTFNDGAVFLALPGILDHVFSKLGLDRQALLPLRKITANSTTILPDSTEVLFGDGRNISVRNSIRQTDMDRVNSELVKLLKKWEPVLNIFTDDLLLHPLSFSRLIAIGWRHLHKFRGSVASELNKLISDESVRSAMSGVMLYAGVPPDKMPVMSMLGLASLFTEGFYLPEGGIGKIPEALSQAGKHNGGQSFLNSVVRRIVVKNGRVKGLEFEEKDPIEVDAVISTMSGMSTFDILLHTDVVPSQMRRKVKRAPLSHKSFVIQLGLANTIDAQSHMYNIIPTMDKQYELFHAPDKELKWLVYSVPTVIMPELAINGGSIVEMYPSINQNIPVDQWDENEKEKMFELGIEALSKWHKVNIVTKRIISPKEFRDKMHLYKGAVYGLSPVADPRAQFPHVSPIHGLYLAGQTTYPGYGIGAAAMSGIFAAKELMKKHYKGIT